MDFFTVPTLTFGGGLLVAYASADIFRFFIERVCVLVVPSEMTSICLGTKCTLQSFEGA